MQKESGYPFCSAQAGVTRHLMEHALLFEQQRRRVELNDGSFTKNHDAMGASERTASDVRRCTASVNKVFHHYPPIVVHDGVEAVSDGQHCAVSELPPYGLLNELISFKVHRGRGLVQNQNFAVT